MRKQKIKSVKEFKEQAIVLMKKLGKTYCSVTVELSHHLRDGSEEEKYSVYIDGYNYISGRTPEEALENTEIATGLKSKPSTDLEL